MRSLKLSVCLANIVVAIAGVNCTTDNLPNNGGSGSGNEDAMKACMDEEMAICALRASCSEWNLDKTYASEAACDVRAVPACLSTLAAAGTSWTPTTIEACAQAYPSESCSDFFDSNPVAACVPAAGTLEDGSACGASAQCSSTFCAVSADAICGMCADLPAVGDDCQVAADCGRDLACVIPSGETDGTCAQYSGSGAGCLTGTQPCASGLACVGDNVGSGTMGLCKPAGAAIGAACDSSRKTMANCDGTTGFVCIPAGSGSSIGTCQMIQLVAAGSACGDIGSNPITGFADCIDGGECIKASTTATTGTCLAPAADGAQCNSDPTIGPPCQTGAKCVATTDGDTAGTCMTPAAASCVDSDDGDD